MHSINELITLKLINKKIKLFYSEDGTLTIIANNSTLIFDIKLSNATICKKVMAFLKDKYNLGYNVVELYQKFLYYGFNDLPLINDMKHMAGLIYKVNCSNVFEIYDCCFPKVRYGNSTLENKTNEKAFFSEHIIEIRDKLYEELVDLGMDRLLSTIESPFLQVESLIRMNKHCFDVEKAKSIKVNLDNLMSNTTDFSMIREIEYVINSYLIPYINSAEQNNSYLEVKVQSIDFNTGEISYFPKNPLELSNLSSDYGIQSCFRSMDDEHSIVRIKLSNLIVQVMSTFLWSNELDSFCSIEDFYKDVAELAGQYSSKTVSAYRDVAYAIIYYLVYGFADSFSVYDLGISEDEFKDCAHQLSIKFPDFARGIRNCYEYMELMHFTVSLTDRYIPTHVQETKEYYIEPFFMNDSLAGNLINSNVTATSLELMKFKSTKVNELLLPVPDCRILWINQDEIAIQMPDSLIDEIGRAHV